MTVRASFGSEEGDRPIVLSRSGVRAVLEGRKKQACMIARSNLHQVPPYIISKTPSGYRGEYWCEPGGWISCPLGEVGSTLWVREAWDYFGGNEYLYLQELGAVFFQESILPSRDRQTWRPAISMPRWASRIRLRVDGVRVAQLAEVTEQDASLQGFGSGARGLIDFRVWWDETRCKPWRANLWVWLVDFSVQCRREINGSHAYPF